MRACVRACVCVCVCVFIVIVAGADAADVVVFPVVFSA